MILFGGVGRQLQAGEDLAEKQPGAKLARNQVGVLALPADAGSHGRGLLHHRRGVDEDLDLRPVGLGDAARQALQSALHELVVVAAPRIDRNCAALAPLEQGQRIIRRAVIEADGDDRPDAGP